MTKRNVVRGKVIPAVPTMAQRRKDLKFGISTTSLTSSGVTPIRGATKYPGEPSIYFTREAWVKQCHLVDKCKQEVGWFALVDYDEKYNTFTITELVIPCQEVTAAETDIGKEDLADAAMELIEAGKDTSKMYAWFHSHVNMGVSPSAQDEYQVEDFLEDLADQPEVPAFIRGIQNKKGDLKLDVYYIQHGIAYQNLDFHVIHDDDPQWAKDIDGEIATKVKERVSYYNNGYGGVGGGRPATGKSLGSAPNGSYDWNRQGLRGGYGGLYDHVQGDWWDEYEDDITEVGSPVMDTPDAPKPVNMPHHKYAEMEIVYQSPENKEVLSDIEGQLWVCDDNGELYHYEEYTEAYGEIDEGGAKGHKVPFPAVVV
jgi:hypothetical protein